MRKINILNFDSTYTIDTGFGTLIKVPHHRLLLYYYLCVSLELMCVVCVLQIGVVVPREHLPLAQAQAVQVGQPG